MITGKQQQQQQQQQQNCSCLPPASPARRRWRRANEQQLQQINFSSCQPSVPPLTLRLDRLHHLGHVVRGDAKVTKAVPQVVRLHPVVVGQPAWAEALGEGAAQRLLPPPSCHKTPAVPSLPSPTAAPGGRGGRLCKAAPASSPCRPAACTQRTRSQSGRARRRSLGRRWCTFRRGCRAPAAPSSPGTWCRSRRSSGGPPPGRRRATCGACPRPPTPTRRRRTSCGQPAAEGLLVT